MEITSIARKVVGFGLGVTLGLATTALRRTFHSRTTEQEPKPRKVTPEEAKDLLAALDRHPAGRLRAVPASDREALRSQYAAEYKRLITERRRQGYLNPDPNDVFRLSRRLHEQNEGTGA